MREKIDASRLADLDIEKFIERFEDNYVFLYNHCDRVAGFTEALDYGDVFIRCNPGDFMGRFNSARQDPVISDREVAALAFTLDDCGLI